MRRFAAICMTCAAILLVVAGCGPSVVSLDAEDSGTSIALDVGDTLKIALSSNPSTGYSWQIVSKPSCVESAGESEFESEGAEGVVGAGGTETLSFEATKAGRGTLELEYRRPWETGVEPEDTFSVDVTVSE